MRLSQLRYIWEVARHDLNVSAASEAIFTAQPNVSKFILMLEEELGVDIFARRGKHLVHITPAGLDILEITGEILHGVERIKEVARRHRGETELDPELSLALREMWGNG